MKNYTQVIIIALVIILLLLTGCKSRQVTQLLDDSKQSNLQIESNESSSPQENASNSPTESESTYTKLTTGSEENPSQDNTNQETTQDSTQDTTQDTNTKTTYSANQESASEVTEDTSTQTDELEQQPTDIIIVESENLDEVDERAIILNELDDLLNSVLTTLDDLEENPITEDVTNIGGE